MQDSVIYTRVSSEKQRREGNGSSSQEQRCRSFIQMQGYRLLAAFGDEAVSGAALDRPGMKQLLSFLKSHRGKEPIMVVVDDISRLARDVKTHIELRATIQAAGGKLISPSFNFEDSAIGQFMETIFAGMAQYGRTGNREQVINRQLARLQQGFWTFPAPPGYEYKRHPTYKKLVVPDPLRSAMVKDALEGFANNRLVTQRDMVEFLKRRGFFGEVENIWFSYKYESRVRCILDNVVFYAGFIEYPDWGIDRRVGMHLPLIDRHTLLAIEEKLSRSTPRPFRADNREDFWLRNYVRCSSCLRPLTGSIVKRRYPRYHCYWKGCSVRGKTIWRDKMHEEFEELLMSLTASDAFMKMVREVTRDLWQHRISQWNQEATQYESQIQTADREIAALVRRIGKTSEESLIEEYEKEIKELKAQRLRAEQLAEKHREGPPDSEEALKRVGTILKNPYAVWKSGSREQKRLVCSLVFTTPPIYDRKGGFGTTDLSLPYRISQQFCNDESRMVDLPKDTWYSFWTTIVEWGALWKGFEEQEAAKEAEHKRKLREEGIQLDLGFY